MCSGPLFSSTIGRCTMSSRMRLITLSAASSLVLGSSTRNSSPPKRATVSLLRNSGCNACANARSTWSPIRWPWASLIFLKSSRSMKAIDSGQSWRLARSNCWLSRMSSWCRLYTPVSASRLACSARRRARCSDSSACRRAWVASWISRRLRSTISSRAWLMIASIRSGCVMRMSKIGAITGRASAMPAITSSKRRLSSCSSRYVRSIAKPRAASVSALSQMSATLPDSSTHRPNVSCAGSAPALRPMLRCR